MTTLVSLKICRCGTKCISMLMDMSTNKNDIDPLIILNYITQLISLYIALRLPFGVFYLMRLDGVHISLKMREYSMTVNILPQYLNIQSMFKYLNFLCQNNSKTSLKRISVVPARWCRGPYCKNISDNHSTVLW